MIKSCRQSTAQFQDETLCGRHPSAGEPFPPYKRAQRAFRVVPVDGHDGGSAVGRQPGPTSPDSRPTAQVANGLGRTYRTASAYLSRSLRMMESYGLVKLKREGAGVEPVTLATEFLVVLSESKVSE